MTSPHETDPVLARIAPRWNGARTERNLIATQERLSGRRRARPRWRLAIVVATLATGGAALAARFDLLPRAGRAPVAPPAASAERPPAPVAAKRVSAAPLPEAPAEVVPNVQEPARHASRPSSPAHTNSRAGDESAEGLIHAADEARRAGKAADAVPLLQRLLREHPADVRAPLAAFTLGRVLLAQLRRPGEAADAFALARRLAPHGALAGDALAREVEASARAGDAARAARLAADYVAAYPHGQRREAVRRWGGLD
ncbi:MAG TPA: hypothetical protein VHU40_15860 [Polyangia bacterium]|nr:hypothetical protein [Polyangia bacterium]